jgi:hypothetical protein
MGGSTCVNVFNCTYMYVVLFLGVFTFLHNISVTVKKMFHTKIVNNNETCLLSVHFFS